MAQYQYSLVDVQYVKQNPEEFIIPDCLDACRILWEKGIDTTQCSNFEDKNCRWIEIDVACLSKENYNYLYNMINSKVEGFSLGGMTHYPRIYVNKTGMEANLRLCELANSLLLQDTKQFITVEEYLDSYKRRNGEYTTLPTGVVQRQYNPMLINATLADALEANNDWNLYIESEGRIYNNEDALNHHLDYLEKLQKIGKKM